MTFRKANTQAVVPSKRFRPTVVRSIFSLGCILFLSPAGTAFATFTEPFEITASPWQVAVSFTSLEQIGRELDRKRIADDPEQIEVEPDGYQVADDPEQIEVEPDGLALV